MREQPKTRHGREKELEADDPLALVMTPVSGGDLQLMATCLIEEFARMGLKEAEILALFRQPIYQTHALYRAWGEGRVRDLVRQVLARTGRTCVSVTVLPHIGGDDA